MSKNRAFKYRTVTYSNSYLKAFYQHYVLSAKPFNKQKIIYIQEAKGAKSNHVYVVSGKINSASLSKKHPFKSSL